MRIKTCKQCVNCVMDETVPGIKFDEKGVCNFCALHKKMDKEFPEGEKGKKILIDIGSKIKREGEDKQYDCVVGVSGGRDSSYCLYYIKKILGLKPIAVHFNDGFGNPVAGENMIKICKKLDIPLRTITSDWREGKDIRIAFLKGSTPDLEEGADVGIATSLYGVAVKEKVRYIIIGQSFRTEGIAPLGWNYLDGKYLKSVHKKFGKIKLRSWHPTDPGFNLDIKEMLYYVFLKRIKIIPILYYADYKRDEVSKFLEKEFNWKDTGAHYFDDLYQSLMAYVYRIKFKIDRRLFNYSALIRSGQMTKDEAMLKIKKKYHIEDLKIINLCIKRLGLSKKEFQEIMEQPIKTFRDYDNNFKLLIFMKPIIWLCAKIDLLPGSAYDKYFSCG